MGVENLRSPSPQPPLVAQEYTLPHDPMPHTAGQVPFFSFSRLKLWKLLPILQLITEHYRSMPRNKP
jgi:hypothetical protein